MDAADSHQTTGFSADAYSPYVPHQPLNLALENAWVGLHIVYPLLNAHLSMCIPLQVPPAPANNQREDMPPPGRVAEPGRMHDLHHIDVAYQGIVNYHPQPLAVSYFYLSVDGPLLINDTRAIESRIHIS